MNEVEFITKLAYRFKAVILYEPLVYRRLHDSNYINDTWEQSYYEGEHLIIEYKNNKQLPSAIANDALFRLNINFGESCLERRKNVKGIGKFLKAWSHKPASIIPLKKSAKSIVRFLFPANKSAVACSI